VQAEASALLAEMMWKYPECSGSIIRKGLLQLVVESVERHVGNMKVQQMGCGFFRALSYENESHPAISRARGLEMIIGSMKRNAKKCEVMKECCIFLQNVLFNPRVSPETPAYLVASGIISIIVNGMTTFSDSAYLETACGGKFGSSLLPSLPIVQLLMQSLCPSSSHQPCNQREGTICHWRRREMYSDDLLDIGVVED
jgi:hypothetical protein